MKYTYVLNFRGGVYISQVEADSLINSLDNWSKQLDISQIQYLGEKSKNELRTEILKEEPMPLNGLENVWCVHLIISVGSMLINIVQTG